MEPGDVDLDDDFHHALLMVIVREDVEKLGELLGEDPVRTARMLRTGVLVPELLRDGTVSAVRVLEYALQGKDISTRRKFMHTVVQRESIYTHVMAPLMLNILRLIPRSADARFEKCVEMLRIIMHYDMQQKEPLLLQARVHETWCPFGFIVMAGLVPLLEQHEDPEIWGPHGGLGMCLHTFGIEHLCDALVTRLSVVPDFTGAVFPTISLDTIKYCLDAIDDPPSQSDSPLADELRRESQGAQPFVDELRRRVAPPPEYGDLLRCLDIINKLEYQGHCVWLKELGERLLLRCSERDDDRCMALAKYVLTDMANLNCNRQDASGKTAMYHALLCPWPNDMLELLYSRGASLLLVGDDRKDMIHEAIYGERVCEQEKQGLVSTAVLVAQRRAYEHLCECAQRTLCRFFAEHIRSEIKYPDGEWDICAAQPQLWQRIDQLLPVNQQLLAQLPDTVRPYAVPGMSLRGVNGVSVYEQCPIAPYDAWQLTFMRVVPQVATQMVQVVCQLQAPRLFHIRIPSTLLLTLVGSGHPDDRWLPLFGGVSVTVRLLDLCISKDYIPAMQPSDDVVGGADDGAAGADVSDVQKRSVLIDDGELAQHRSSQSLTGRTRMAFKPLYDGVDPTTPNDEDFVSVDYHQHTEREWMAHSTASVSWTLMPIETQHPDLPVAVTVVPASATDAAVDGDATAAATMAPPSSSSECNTNVALNLVTVTITVTLMRRSLVGVCVNNHALECAARDARIVLAQQVKRQQQQEQQQQQQQLESNDDPNDGL